MKGRMADGASLADDELRVKEASPLENEQQEERRGAFDELRGALAGFEPTQEELDADPRLAHIWLKYINIDSDTAEG